MSGTGRKGHGILGVFVDALTQDQAMEQVLAWGQAGEHRQVAFVGVDGVISGRSNPDLLRALRQMDMALPDGMPVAWALRKAGYKDQERLGGPDFTEKLFLRCHEQQRSLALYGSTPEVIDILKERLRTKYPGARLAWAYSPPFRALSEEEKQDILGAIKQAAPEFLLVGLGCPKQEIWMMENRNNIDSVLLGVGAAFDFSAGTKKRAPVWMRRSGLEWFHRVLSDPRRLAKRFMKVVPLFLYYWVTNRVLDKNNGT